VTPEPVSRELPPDVRREPYVWLTTVGRRTGEPRTVELWFGLDGRTVYFLAGGGERAHWVRNALARPDGVGVRLGATSYGGRARAPAVGSEEERNARRMLAAKYQGWREGSPLSRWAATSYCLAVDLDVEDPGSAR
jgi:deazaflavin-dependent oxidoreductase (nitroreductase family)